jgi:hypothetical protein
MSLSDALQRVAWFASLAGSRELTCLAWLHLLLLDLFQARYAIVFIIRYIVQAQCHCIPDNLANHHQHQLQVSIHGRPAPEDTHEALARAMLHVRPSRAAVAHDHRSASFLAAKLSSTYSGCLAHWFS